ncbi:phage tail protein [Desulfocurvibacter africanus]|uniref:phage tail protein n=1 Tax=Desulfocurvibacter africanus TaxID=873 RepID=UPI0004240AED|nr:phage tail protein [Desulfocurvibacter africanus]
MAEQFYTILTKVGHAKLANALALGQSVSLTHMAVGQGVSGGYYEPTETQTALKSEAWRGPVNALNVDPQNASWLVAELVIPTSVGNFTVREAGLFDVDNDLIAVGKYPQTYKPQLADGAGKDLYIRLIVQVSNTSVVTLKVDPAVVLATRGYAEAQADEAEIAAKAYSDGRLAAHSDSYRGFGLDGRHTAYTGDLDAIERNSLYAVQKGQATHLPADMPAGVQGFVQTMVQPADSGRTQLVWSVDDAGHPGWWRRRVNGGWGEWSVVGAAMGLPVGTVVWVPGTTPPPGMLAVNAGDVIGRSTWPELWEFAQASGLLVTDTEWQAQASVHSSVGNFSDGDGSTTFRLPKLVDYLRGADPSNGRPVGLWQGDEFKAHNHQLSSSWFNIGSAGSGTTLSGALVTQGLTTGSSGGFETRPKSINWLPCIQAASLPVNSGTVDMLALAAEVARLSSGTGGEGLSSGLPVGTMIWVPGTTPLPGMLAVNDGASVSRTTWPQLWEYAQNSGLLITEAEWQGQAAAQTSVGYFSDGDGVNTFRLPRLRDFVRGADPSNGRGVGTWQADGIKQHNHPIRVSRTVGVGGSTTVLPASDTETPSVTSTSYITAFGNDETQPKSVSWLPCIQAASVPVYSGTVDMLALASEVAGKADKSGVVFQSAYVSEPQIMVLNGSITLAHGLVDSALNPVDPKVVQCRIKCVVAEGSYSVGDEVIIGPAPDDDGSTGRGLVVVPTATNLFVKVGNGVPTILSKSTTARLNITLANWKLIVRAYA